MLFFVKMPVFYFLLVTNFQFSPLNCSDKNIKTYIIWLNYVTNCSIKLLSFPQKSAQPLFLIVFNSSEQNFFCLKNYVYPYADVDLIIGSMQMTSLCCKSTNFPNLLIVLMTLLNLICWHCQYYYYLHYYYYLYWIHLLMSLL